MVLLEEQIRKLHKEPQNKAALEKAKRHQQRINLFTEPVLDENDISPAFAEWKQWVYSFMLREKADMLLKLCTFPVGTMDLMKQVFSEYRKVFESQNEVFDVRFKGDEKKDFNEFYDKEEFEREAERQMRYGFHSVMVIDMPAAPSEKPKPYSVFLPVECIKDIQCDRRGEIEYIIYESAGKVIALDSEFYHVFEQNDKGEIVNYDSAAHDLGYAPARFFWSDRLNSKDYIGRNSPLSDLLTNLYWYLFFSLSVKYIELYGAFPVLAHYEFDNRPGEEEGDKQADNIEEKNIDERLGPGGVIKVPAPQMKDDADLMSNLPANWMNIPEESLRFCNEKLDKLEEEIYFAATGYGGEAINNKAVNEKQVKGMFESRQNVLLEVARNISKAHEFQVRTISRLRYADKFEEAVVSRGDKFFLHTESQLQEDYKTAKESGLPMSELAAKRRELTATRHKNDPRASQRAELLSELEPYPDLSIEQLMGLSSFIDREKFIIKLHFNDFIERFERENGNILAHLSESKKSVKIESIYKTLKTYVTEINYTEQTIDSKVPEVRE